MTISKKNGPAIYPCGELKAFTVELFCKRLVVVLLGVYSVLAWSSVPVTALGKTTVAPMTVAALAPARTDDSWYLEANMLNLGPINRFIGSLTATNPGKSPIYIRTTVARVQAVGDTRTRRDDSTGTLRAFPAEFVLRPGESFPVRLLVDLAKLESDSQSYYVKLEDVSNMHVEVTSSGGAVAASFLLAYEALVSVERKPLERLAPEHFGLARTADGGLTLKNLSGQHLYLNRGDACPNAQTLLVNCAPLADFPRQTMLPNEVLKLPAMTAPVLGFLAYPTLNSRSKANLLYLTTPGAP